MSERPSARQARLEEILLQHDELVAAGSTTPLLDEYVKLHPDLAAELRAHFELDARFRRYAGPFCALAGSGVDEPLPLRSFGKYEVLRKEGGGGMGVVVRAVDLVVKREVVLKVLKENFLANADALRRFRLEGQLLGQLEHPDIVPLHEMGETPDKKPYLAMKLVRGMTLADHLGRRRGTAERREWFLDVFVRICHAVHFAHSKRVLHRDLKPANAMIGEHNEVQLADFGLAKLLSPAGAAPNPRAALAVTAPESGTYFGQVMGTLAYLAPEQGRGELDALDPRCDVFGLGGILCVILTGQPPRTGPDIPLLVRDNQELRGTSLAGAYARLDASGQPPALVALCKRCLAYAPDDRPADARAVAEAVADYRAGLVKAEREKDLEAAAANERARQAVKKQRLAYGLLAAVVLLVGVGALAWGIEARRRAHAAELARVEEETAAAVDLHVRGSREKRAEARRVEKLGDAKLLFEEGVGQAKQADELAGRGPASEAVMQSAKKALAEAEADLAGVAKDDKLTTRLFELLVLSEDGRTSPGAEPGGFAAGKLVDLERQFAAAFGDWGLDPDRVPAAEAAARIRTRPVAVRTEVIAALDLWALFRRNRQPDEARRLFDVAAAADQPDPVRQELRRLLSSKELNQARLRELARAEKPGDEPTLTLLLRGFALWGVHERDNLESRLQAIVSRLRAAVLARPSDPLLRAYLGKMCMGRGILLSQGPAIELMMGMPMGTMTPPGANLLGSPTAAAAPHFYEAVACFEVLRSWRPKSRLELAVALVETTRAEEGLALLREIRKERQDDPLVHLCLATALMKKGKVREAAEAANAGAKLGGTTFAGHVGLLQEALLAMQAKEWKKMEALCREALASAKDDTTLGLAYGLLGAALHGQGRTAETLKAMGESSRFIQGIPSGHAFLAQQSERVNELKTAEIMLRKGLQEDGENAALLVYAADFFRRHGDEPTARKAQQKLAEAKFPDDAKSLLKLGADLQKLKEYKLAVKAFRQLLKAEPNHFDGMMSLAGTLNQTGQPKEAEEVAAKLLALRPESYGPHFVHGWALYGQQRLTEAEAALRKALDLNPSYPYAQLILGDTLRRLKKTAAAETFLRRALEGLPNEAAGHFWLSEVLRAQGKEEEAREVYAKALKLKGAQNP